LTRSKLSPGDPAAVRAGMDASQDDIAARRRQMGLDRPLYVQYGKWVWQLLHGNLGYSYSTGSSVAGRILDRTESGP